MEGYVYEGQPSSPSAERDEPQAPTDGGRLRGSAAAGPVYPSQDDRAHAAAAAMHCNAAMHSISEPRRRHDINTLPFPVQQHLRNLNVEQRMAYLQMSPYGKEKYLIEMGLLKATAHDEQRFSPVEAGPVAAAYQYIPANAELEDLQALSRLVDQIRRGCLDKSSASDLVRLIRPSCGLGRDVWRAVPSPLVLAVKYPQKNPLEVINQLLKAGVKINSIRKNENGMKSTTALHQAIKEGQKEAVKFLLDNGADPKIICTSDMFAGDALDWARQCELELYSNAPEITKMLEIYYELVEKVEKDVNKNVDEISVLESKLRKARAIQASIKVKHAKSRSLKREAKMIDDEIRELSESSDYLCPGKVDELCQHVRQSKLREARGKNGRPINLELMLECVVCLAVPKEKVFSCFQCDKIICSVCLSKLKETKPTSCPSCRTNFEKNSPKRNRLAESILDEVEAANEAIARE